jgi:hypothetical protein
MNTVYNELVVYILFLGLSYILSCDHMPFQIPACVRYWLSMDGIQTEMTIQTEDIICDQRYRYINLQ